MDLDTMETGMKTSRMDMELKDGLMGLPMKDNISKERNMEKANLHGLMVVLSLETS
jgi:hypothetical protein